MKKKGLLLVVALLALSGLMAAMAYNSAVVTNAATLKVSKTKDSVLSLAAMKSTMVGNKDITAEVVDGDLVFYLGRGRTVDIPGDDGMRGFQRNSTYTWNRLFAVQNLSKEDVKLSMMANNVPAGVTIKVNGIDITNKPGLMFANLQTGWTKEFSFEIEVGPNAQQKTYNLEIIVISEAI